MEKLITVREFLLKKYPGHEYLDCPVPEEYWEDIEEYASLREKEAVEQFKEKIIKEILVKMGNNIINLLNFIEP